MTADDMPTSHTDNLRPRPTQRNTKCNMTQTVQQSAIASHSKP